MKGKKMKLKTGAGHTCHISFCLVENDKKELVVYIIQRFFVPKGDVEHFLDGLLRIGKEVALIERRMAFRLSTFKSIYRTVMQDALTFLLEKRGAKQFEANLTIQIEPKEVSNDNDHAKAG